MCFVAARKPLFALAPRAKRGQIDRCKSAAKRQTAIVAGAGDQLGKVLVACQLGGHSRLLTKPNNSTNHSVCTRFSDFCFPLQRERNFGICRRGNLLARVTARIRRQSAKKRLRLQRENNFREYSQFAIFFSFEGTAWWHQVLIVQNLHQTRFFHEWIENGIYNFLAT